MNARTFYIVDVFAEAKYAGNQLAVFRNAQGLSDEQMQTFAREMNFSETTFILSDAEHDSGYDVRIFTPVAEVPFAGHPTLGTAYVIREEIIGEPIEQVNLNLKVGQIPVTFDRQAGSDMLWMKQKPPEFGPVLNPAEIAGMLRLNEADVDTPFPIQEVSTGIWFLIVPLKNLDAVKRARVDHDKYFTWVETRHKNGVLVFSPETYDSRNDLNVRVFVPCYGVDEDPATGSGNGCLAGYLVRHRYFASVHIDIRVEQGYEIERPSLLRLKAENQGETIDVNVAGKVVMVAKGQWL
jgi:trans-2,3-dihydro-3-hydroxyanthranilate isomerase